MVPFNLIGITKFRTPEFLANIRIYDNEFFIVIKNDEPFLIGFPPIVLDRVVLETGFTETVKVTKRQVQRGETFGKEKPEIGKIYLLTEKGVPDFAFVTFMPFKTYPAVAGIFAQ